jgi:DNA-binding MarR family transcriptional regulator
MRDRSAAPRGKHQSPALGNTAVSLRDDLARCAGWGKPGSLYPALHKLEQEGWLTTERLISDTRRRVKFYSLIREARKQLDQTADWKRLSGATHPLIRAQDGLWSSAVIVSCELTNDTLALATP